MRALGPFPPQAQAFRDLGVEAGRSASAILLGSDRPRASFCMNALAARLAQGAPAREQKA
jgi:hypothetical protein